MGDRDSTDGRAGRPVRRDPPWRLRALHWLPAEAAADGPNRWLVVGFYDNEAVRTADGWRLTRVKLTSKYQENAHFAAAGQAG
ncbi:nuclear transport factor 2 family protein [Streptomyces sp. AC512_CC834]|uniref:nuclear transport factor 2 family protein n=1 Tax=Streptomyces sp. AC512_CC834 TaxID=2823691 RepID=UPI001C26BE65